MTLYMFDGAYDANDIAAAKAAGGIAMSHYLTGSFVSTSAQPDAIRAAGMGAVLNYERAAGQLVGMSRADARTVAQTALAAVEPGVPRNNTVAIYFSVDVRVELASITDCDQAFAGINDVLVPAHILPKCYAEGALIDHLCSKGLVVDRQWLSSSSSFPGYNVNDDNVCMWQQVGSPVPNTDRNVVTFPHSVAAWWNDNSPYGANVPSLDATDLTNVQAQCLAAVRAALTLSPANMTIIQNGQADNDNAWSIMNGRLVAIAAAVGAAQSMINSVASAVTAVNSAVGQATASLGNVSVNQAALLTAVAALPTSGWTPSPDEIAQLADQIGVADQQALADAVRHDFASALAVDPTPPPAS